MEMEKKGKSKEEKPIEYGGVLHPGGGVGLREKLVYEPIGNYEYLWIYGGKRGRSRAFFREKEGWFVKIGEDYFKLKGGVISELAYTTPVSEDSIGRWLRGEYKVKRGAEIYAGVLNYMKSFLDLPREHYYITNALLVLESWLVEFLMVVFYGSIIGGFGSGKTAALEALAIVMRHGVLAGSIKSSGIARVGSDQKLSLLFDEFDVGSDKKGDNEANKIVRQAYRRGNTFIRMKQTRSSGFIAEIFNHFGVCAFSLHSDLERALKTRGLIVNIGESDDSRLPVINLYKQACGKKIAEGIFFWYMENATSEKVSQVSKVFQVPQVSIDSLFGDNFNVENFRKELYDNATKIFPEEYNKFLKETKGRDCELAYIALIVSLAFGVSGILNDLKESFKEKRDTEAEYDEDVYKQLLKEVLAEWYEKLKEDENQRTKAGITWVKRQSIQDDFNSILKERSWDGASNYKLKGYLRDLGFVDQVTMKKKKIKYKEEDKEKVKTIMCLYFDKKVRYRLGLLGTTDILETGEIPETKTEEVEEPHPEGTEDHFIVKRDKARQYVEYSWNPPTSGSSDEELMRWIYGVQNVIANLSDDEVIEAAVSAGWIGSKVHEVLGKLKVKLGTKNHIQDKKENG